MTARPPRSRAPAPSRARFGVAVALFGFITGLLAGTIIYGRDVTRLALALEQLQADYTALKEDYERLRSEPPKENRPVRELALRFPGVKNERLRIELNRRLRALLAPEIIGTPVTELDPLKASRIVHGRLFAVEGELWEVDVEGAYLIWDTLILYVQPEPAGRLQEDPAPL